MKATRKIWLAIAAIALTLTIIQAANAALTDGLVSYYSGDTSSATTLKDDYGAYNGSGPNFPDFLAVGKIAGAYKFTNGNADYVNLATDTQFFGADPSAYSISFWANFTDNTAARTLASCYDHPSGGDTVFPFDISYRGDLTPDYLIVDARNPTSYEDSYAWTPTLNTYYFITITFNETGVWNMYINGASVKTKAMGAGDFTDGGTCRLGAFRTSGTISNYFNGVLDEIGIWNRALTPTEITTLYNSGTGLNPIPGPSPPSPTISFQGQTPANATNTYWQDNLTINTTAANFGGTVTTSHFIYNSTMGLVAQLNSTSATYTSNTASLTPGTYYFNASATNGTSSNNTETRQANITWWNAYLNLSLNDARNGSLVGPATVNLTDLNTSWFTQYNTTNGNLLAQIAKGDTIEISIDANGHELKRVNYTANTSTQQATNITLYTNNSLSITILDENTGFIIVQNITVVVTGASETTYTTTSGTLYIDNLPDGTYSVKFSGTNYTLNTYSVTVGSRSHQSLTAYLTASISSTIFTIRDFESSGVMENAVVTQSRLINGTWTVVNAKASDITGRAQLSYLPNVKYQFIVSKTGYTTQTFYLDPILFGTYDIRLRQTATLVPSNTPDLLGVSISYYNSQNNQTRWDNNANNTLVWTITSPGGSLEAYNVTINWPQGNTTLTGTNAIGEQKTYTFQITDAQTTDRVTISYCYKSTTSSSKCFAYPWTIQNATAGPGTWAANKGQTYGMGLFERVLVATAFVLGVGGMIFMLGGMVAGLIVSLIMLGAFVTMGFIPLWAVLPSMLVGFFIIIRGGSNG